MMTQLKMPLLFLKSNNLKNFQSSGMHIAAAVGTPYLVIYGGYTSPEQFGPYKAKGRIISKNVACRYCFGKRECEKGCLSNISVEDVLSEIERS